MQLDIQREFFSRFGSYTSLAWYPGTADRQFDDGLYLCCHHGGTTMRREVFKVDAVRGDGELIDKVKVVAKATELRLLDGDGESNDQWAGLCFDERGRVSMRGQGLGLQFRALIEPGVVAYEDGPGLVSVNARAVSRRFGFELLHGRLELDAPWGPNTCESITIQCLPDTSNSWEAVLDDYTSTWVRDTNHLAYEAVQQECTLAFQKFADAFGQPGNDELADAWLRAIYVNWAAVVAPCGHYKRPTMLMSKHWMDQCWSWDHCFNAQALAGAWDALAWDQWQVLFDHQDQHGAIPDAVNDVSMQFCYNKPPVHGWTVQELLKRCSDQPSDDFLKTICIKLERHTNWFLQHRRMNDDALPYYLHGNDSGWDNSTMFDLGVPLIAPDLAALLVIQTEALASLHERLGNLDAKDHWATASQTLLQGLLQLWDGQRFVPQRIENNIHKPVDCDSLIPLIPIFLGKRLPESIRQTLATGLERLTTEHGIATEYTQSPNYVSDGYWRGPIWAPSTYLVVCGLRESGFHELADRIATGFCQTCAREGFAENFDALTGVGLRDRAYTWTSSVFLLLAGRNECKSFE